MGSGSLAAMAIFETEWRVGMEEEDAVALVSKAIQSGIFNDLGSGSNVDVCVIKKDRTDMRRNFVKPNERVQKEKNYVFRRGATDFKRDRELVRSLVVSEDVRPHDAMDES
jgi:20S proteasome subunit beta 2